MTTVFPPPGIREIREEYVKLADSSDYQHYAPYRSRLDEGMEVLVARVVNEAASFYADFLPDLTYHHSLWESARQRARWLLVAIVVLAVFAVSTLLVQSGLSAAPIEFSTWAALVGGVASGSGLLMSLRSRFRSAVASSEAKVASLKAGMQRKVSASVKEAFTQVLNETLGPENKLPFPTVAPRLVELDTSAVVPSSTANFLKRFVEGHESSAIGIAGPRGSGKSTLMRGLTTDGKHRHRSVWLTAPVRYESVDFIRRLYLEVAHTVAGANAAASRKSKLRKLSSVLFARAVLGVSLILVGALFVVFDSYGVSLMQPKFSVAGVTGIVVSVSGFIVLVLGIIADLAGRSSANGGTKAGKVKPSVLLAMEAITRLSYDTETSAKSKNVAKFIGSALSLEDENSITLKDRDLSHADLVSGLRNLLQVFAQDENGNAVIVVIDELDKISSTTDLIDTINDLKDLFHIEGVHFVVSVSTEALLNFEQRGMITRDAFDSSFDTIVSVKALSLDESLQVISARAEGFPPLVGAFCHAWSGGLPRELLRVARRCVEIQRTCVEAQPVEVLVHMVVAEDVTALVEAAMRSTKNAVKREYLSLLRERARSLHEGRFCLSDAAEVPKTLQGIALVVALAESLCLYFATSVKVGTAPWSTPDPVREPLEAAAEAMAQRGEPHEIRAELFKRAMSALVGQPTPRESSQRASIRPQQPCRFSNEP